MSQELQTRTENNLSMGYYSPEHLDQALRMAEKFFKADCFGSSVKNVEQAFVIMQAGAEMGFAPIESLNSFYIVNGKITIYGSALAKALRKHKWLIEYEDCSEKSATVKISKNGVEHKYTATAAMMAKLKSKAFQFAPEDKLRWHALSRLVRQYVPEVLGPVSYTAEEAESFINIVETNSQKPQLNIDELLSKIEKTQSLEDYKNICAEIAKIKNALREDEYNSLIQAAKNKKQELDNINNQIQENEPPKNNGEIK